MSAGRIADPSRLPAINIGLLTAREIEGRDDALAERLHTVSAEARRMALET